MSTALSKAEQNALCVSYDVMGSHVELDLQFVKSYLVRGAPDKVTDQEIVFFMNTCMAQKLNPLVAGEAYCIKFGNEPAQMVVGKGAYLRRAFEHPDYLFKEDGIVVSRGGEIVQKEGCCLYPGETLIGGWCRVHFIRNGKERTCFKEVSFSEYDKGQANWKSKPATMVNKVAISQCVREAFPKDYEGLYSEEEMIASGAIPQDVTGSGGVIAADGVIVDDPPVTQEQRQTIFKTIRQYFTKTEGNEIVKGLLEEEGLESTDGLLTSQYNRIMERVRSIVAEKTEQQREDTPAEE